MIIYLNDYWMHDEDAISVIRNNKQADAISIIRVIRSF